MPSAAKTSPLFGSTRHIRRACQDCAALRSWRCGDQACRAIEEARGANREHTVASIRVNISAHGRQSLRQHPRYLSLSTMHRAGNAGADLKSPPELTYAVAESYRAMELPA